MPPTPPGPANGQSVEFPISEWFDIMDEEEYEALPPGYQKWVDRFISGGSLNTSAGSFVRTKLEAMFGLESITITRLNALD